MEKKRCIVVVGQTASGKTGLAVDIAQKYGMEIVSADSRQVYRELTIGTGKDLDLYAQYQQPVRYHMIDCADVANVFTLYDFLSQCEVVLQDLSDRKVVPCICGGSGLYVEALLRKYQLSAVEERPTFRAHCMQLPKNDLVKLLEDQRYEALESVDFSSKKRIVRALEIAVFQKFSTKKHIPQIPDLSGCVIGIEWERNEICQRIETRLDERFSVGMVEEVKALLDRGIPAERLELLGLEYKFITRHIKGFCTFDQMRSALLQAIIQFSKRQMTYFRGMERRGIKIHWVSQGKRESVWPIINNFLEKH